MIDIFDKKPIDMANIVCHSGGAEGSDTAWEKIGEKFGVKTKAYSYKTKVHTSSNKVEISDEDYKEGISEVNKANKFLNRYGIHKYMNLLARNWAQVKYSKQVFAIGTIIKPGEKNSKGYYNKGKYDIVDGGTGYAVQMGINNEREVFVFDQVRDKWFRWSYSTLQFVEIKDTPVITNNDFAGIGTRELEPNGLKAIRDIYEKSLKNK
jgi:hypothetical protein